MVEKLYNLIKSHKFPETTQLQLPSRGVIYSPDTLVNQSGGYIMIKQLTGHEEKILTNNIVVNAGLAENFLVNACVISDDISVEDLTVFDRDIILLTLRGTSYEWDIPMKKNSHNCKACDEPVTLSDISLAQAFNNTKTLHIDPIENGKNLFLYEDNNIKIKFKLLTVKDESELKRLTKQDIEVFGKSRHILNYLMTIVQEFNGSTDKNEIEKGLKKLPYPVFNKLSFFLIDQIPSVLIETSYECESCGYKEKIKAGDLLDLFMKGDDLREYHRTLLFMFMHHTSLSMDEILNLSIEERRWYFELLKKALNPKDATPDSKNADQYAQDAKNAMQRAERQTKSINMPKIR